MKKPDIWMPFFVADYCGDTAHLNTEQHGAYLLLLMAAWMRGGRLPVDEAQLAAITKLHKRAWARNRVVLLPFFDRDGQYLVQKRLQYEYLRAQDVQAKRSAIGTLGGTASAAARAARKATEGATDGATVGSTLGSTAGSTVAQANTQPDGKQTLKQNPTPPPLHSVSIETGERQGAVPEEPDAMMWRTGIQLLVNAGVVERQARSILGKHAKAAKAKLAEVIGGMAVARPPIIDPVAYLERAMAPQEKRVAMP